MWGSGSKGVTFLNVLQTQNQIRHIVDINPRKQGKFIPGSGQQIIAPEALKANPPDVIIIVNAIYESEIQQQLQEMGLTPKFVCV